MSYRATVSIGNFNFPEPSEYESTTATLVDSARNAQGYVVGAVIRDDVTKISMKWNYLSPEDLSNILKQFSPSYGGQFYCDVTFLNQVTNDWITRKMYVSDRKSSIHLRNPQTGAISGYQAVSLSLVEV